jgi:glutamate decarboxylase
MASKDAEIAALQKQVEELKQMMETQNRDGGRFYASKHAAEADFEGNVSMPKEGWNGRHVMRHIKDIHELDFKERLNTSSYVNVVFEEEEFEVAKLGMQINLADQTVYPASFKLHDTCVNMVANLWNCPEPKDFAEKKVYAGAQTVGSTEACLLAGLCLKYRWREWYAKKHGLSADAVLAIRPNLIISTCFQAAWEKLFKYMDIEPKLLPTSIKTFGLRPEDVVAQADDKTIGVVCIMGNHYAGQYDSVKDVSDALTKLNAEKGFQIGIHVDGASGGFIAPFQKDIPEWDFRVPNVLSISASGHKFGNSVCGTGWVVWRQREGLSEHVAISVSYLGGKGESYTLNFSRPASGVYVQFYKFLRLGHDGYTHLEENCMANTKYIRDRLMKMQKDGKSRFQLLDAGDKNCLPVFAARLNPELKLPYNDIDFQHAVAESHWYVSGYALSMNHPTTEKKMPIFFDESQDCTMFRVVVKSNLTRFMASDLCDVIEQTVADMDVHFHTDKPKKKADKQHSSGHVC